MTLESIEKLRDIVATHDMSKEVIAEIVDLYDEIQAEIDSRYMELPLDADGVPIRVGDIVRVIDDVDKEVIGISSDYLITGNRIDKYRLSRDGWSYAKNVKHVKPDPVKNLLREFALSIDPGADVDTSGAKTVDEYADKLREVMSGE